MHWGFWNIIRIIGNTDIFYSGCRSVASQQPGFLCDPTQDLRTTLPDPKPLQSYHWWVNPWVLVFGGMHVSVLSLPTPRISVTYSIGSALQLTTFFTTLGFVGLRVHRLATTHNFSRPWCSLGSAFTGLSSYSGVHSRSLHTTSTAFNDLGSDNCSLSH
jgi:hypothetical protein